MDTALPLVTERLAYPTRTRRSITRASAARLAQLPGYLLTEARPIIIAIFAIRMIAVNGLISGYTFQRAALVVAWISLTMAVYIYNGISDVVGDRINGSNRPLASGRLSIPVARLSCVILAAFGLALAWECGVSEAVAAALSLILGWAYSAGPTLKRSPTGFAFTIFAGAALTYLAGATQAGLSVGTCGALVVMSAWIGLSSAAKDFSDIDGDRAAGRRSWPVVLGVRPAARLASAAAIGSWLVFVVAGALISHQLLPVAAILGVGTAVFVFVLSKAKPSQDRNELRRPYWTFVLTQFALNLGTSLCVL
jgi:4-hydroxybenzoate polyprenyltransferase